MNKFKIVSPFTPKGDQPEAIARLSQNLNKNVKDQVLLGVTGSGKTFTMAKVIEAVNRPTLVIAHNKTLASQLYMEFRELFPENRIEYFVSYYDYYQPEAYIPSTNTYIEKDASINELIDRMRHSATRSIVERRDVIVVASVSCIYGIGSPKFYEKLVCFVERGKEIPRSTLLAKLVNIQYARNDIDFARGMFRVRGNYVEVFPAYEESRSILIEFLGDSIDRISYRDPLTGKIMEDVDKTFIYPASHFVTPEEDLKQAIKLIREELGERIKCFRESKKLLEAQRIEERTNYDLEMLESVGYCNGIENYSRHLSARKEGEPPYTLIDYFPTDFLLIVDESHVTVPQIGAMYKGDRSRKTTLVEYGFRLPSALDNRPLTFPEFLARIGQVVYVSATPGAYELDRSKPNIVEQIIRPTGLIDPDIKILPAKNQVEDLFLKIKERVVCGERVLVTTLTKRMAEELTDYYRERGLRVKYLHSEIETIERSELIRSLRKGDFDILVGINLLREGLDLPEVSLVAILDADKEGFLRSERSLIQTFGRAARNINGLVLLYADTVTKSMERAISETTRRRSIQATFNIKNNITPASIQKSIHEPLLSIYEKDFTSIPDVDISTKKLTYKDAVKIYNELKNKMLRAAKNLDFEKAVELRDKMLKIKEEFLLS